MDNYELEIFLKNLEYSSRDSIKRQIESGGLSADNIVDIIYAFTIKLRKISNIVNIFEDFDNLEYDEKLRK